MCSSQFVHVPQNLMNSPPPLPHQGGLSIVKDLLWGGVGWGRGRRGINEGDCILRLKHRHSKLQ